MRRIRLPRTHGCVRLRVSSEDMPAVMSLVLLQAAVSLVLPSASAVDPLRDRPILILFVFEFCLAGAYFTLWRAAPDFKVFRGMGAYFALTGVDHVLQYFTGRGMQIYIGAATSLILVEAAADAMQETRRRWTRLRTKLGRRCFRSSTRLDVLARPPARRSHPLCSSRLCSLHRFPPHNLLR